MSPFDVASEVIRGLGVAGLLLTIVFLALRAMDIIKWKWYWLVSPIVVYILGLFIFFVMMVWAMAKGGM